MISLARLCALGLEQLTRMALSGELRPRHLWIALEGAKHYRRKYAEGDRAPQAIALERAATCAKCRYSTVHQMTAVEGLAVFCGPRLDAPADGSTCGCLVAVVDVDGEVHPGAKTSIASERCPQGAWSAVTVHGQTIE